MRFEIKVFGQHFEDIEDFGGWQLIWAGFDVNAAKVALMGLIPHYGEDNLDWNFWTKLKKVLTNHSKRVIIIIVNEREVNKMKTVIIEYAVTDPVTLINKIEKAFPGAMARFTDIDEDYFELSVWDCIDLEGLEDMFAEYV